MTELKLIVVGNKSVFSNSENKTLWEDIKTQFSLTEQSLPEKWKWVDNNLLTDQDQSIATLNDNEIQFDTDTMWDIGVIG